MVGPLAKRTDLLALAGDAFPADPGPVRPRAGTTRIGGIAAAGSRLVGEARAVLPRGGLLPADSWERRHQFVLTLLWLHAALLAALGLLNGRGATHSLTEASVVAGAAALASWTATSRCFREVAASLGLLTASGVLVHLGGGYIELHFHYFVMVAVVALYQAWTPFLLAVAYVLLQHGLLGVLHPEAVYNHPAAIAHPWRWAAIHAGFIAALCGACLTTWRLSEDEQARRLRERSAAEQRRSEARFRALVEHASDMVSVLDAGGMRSYASPAWERVLGYRPEELLDHHAAEIDHPDDAELTRRFFADLARRPGAIDRFEVRVRHKDGSTRWLEVVAVNRLDDPAVGGIVATSRDVTERKQVEARLEHQASHDSLTGLPNRAMLLDRLAGALASRQRTTAVAVLLLDLDGFKLVNDSRGHAAGDELLVAVGRRLRAHLPPGALLARLGGDEFAVLLERVADPAESARLAEHLIEALRHPLDIDGREVFVSASVGVVKHRPGWAKPGDLLRDADTALYQAKTRGPGSWAVFEPGMRASVLARLERETALRGAAERGELRLRYQPKVELATGRVVGVEALIRWEHPDLGLLHPVEFVRLAEETGLIVPLGRWVLWEACRRAREWRDLSGEAAPVVCVNVSACQLREASFVAQVAMALEASGLDPDSLELEITESAVMRDAPEAWGALSDLRKLGVRLAIDDFGTGSSSLGRLRELPVDALKVDRSFVAGLGRDPGSLAIARAVTVLAHDLGLVVTAEGIETTEQASVLRALGVDLGQGFYFAPPLPGEAIAELLAHGARLWDGAGADGGVSVDGVPEAVVG